VIAGVAEGNTPRSQNETEKAATAGLNNYWVTVTATLPVAPDTLAVIVADPVPSRLATPPPLEEILITDELLEVQVASLETVEPFWVATNSICDPAPPLPDKLMLVPWSQVTVIDDDVVQVLPTQTVAVPLTAPEELVLVTVIVTEESAVREIALISPEVLTVTAAVSELLQVVPEADVRFWVVLSLYVPVATSCWV
jgi:hypothetical protein